MQHRLFGNDGDAATSTTTSSLSSLTQAPFLSCPVTIAVHSRHIGVQNDGANIVKELRCIKSLLSLHFQDASPPSANTCTASSSSCQILVISDRERTRSLLSAYFNTAPTNEYWPSTTTAPPKCHAVLVSHDFHGSGGGLYKSSRPEHGPYVGIGFYQDMLLAIQARSGLVHSGRSSSWLVAELLAYDREMEVVRAKNTESNIKEINEEDVDKKLRELPVGINSKDKL